MRVLARLSVFALAPLVGGVCRAAGVTAAAEGASAVARFLADRLSDQSLRVADALRAAADRAWATLDGALAGESLLSAADRGEDRAFREQLRLFVLAAQTDGRAAADPGFVARCRDELTAARDAGLLAGGDADPVALADGLGTLTRFDEPTALLAAQWAVADALAADLDAAGYPALAALVSLRPAADPAAAPLLAVAVRYYFRRAVEDDPRLFQGLAFAQLERLGKAQQDGAAELAALMSRYVERLEARLGELKDTALTTRAEVRALMAALADGGGQRAVSSGQTKPVVEVLSLPTAHSPLPTALQVHTGAVACLAVSPDGTRAVSGGADRGIVVWDLVARRELRVMAGHRDRVCCLAFGPDGRKVLSSGLDQTVRLWDADAGIELKCFDRQTNRSAAFAPDGKTALCGALYDGKLRLFDVATGKELKRLPGHADWVVGVAFAADGKLALSAGLDRAVKLWDVPTGKLLRTFPLRNTILSAVAFSPDGWRVLSAGADGMVRAWDTFTGQELFRLVGHTDAVAGVAPAPDGDRAASAGHDGTVRVWDLRAKREVRKFVGHAGTVHAVAFAPDGRAVLSAGDDGTVRVWALGEG